MLLIAHHKSIIAQINNEEDKTSRREDLNLSYIVTDSGFKLFQGVDSCSLINILSRDRSWFIQITDW